MVRKCPLPRVVLNREPTTVIKPPSFVTRVLPDNVNLKPTRVGERVIKDTLQRYMAQAKKEARA